MRYLRVFTNSLVLRSVTWRLPTLLLGGALLLPVFPVGLALGFTPKSPLVYVTQRDATPDAGAVALIETTRRHCRDVVATVEVGPGPHGMDITSDGKKAYVVNYGTFPNKLGQATSLSDTVSVLRLVTRDPDDKAGGKTVRSPEVVATVKVGLGPLGVAVTPDDREVYVTNFGADPELQPGAVAGTTVSVISARTNEVVATIPVGDLPAGVAIAPDGKHAYVTVRGEDKVAVLDTDTHAVIDTVAVQDKPANVALTPDGLRAYVTNFGSNSVSVIDTATNTVVPVPDGEAIRVGLVPIGLAVTPDGALVYVVNVFSNNVSVINTATNTVISTVAVGRGPRAVAVTPDGAYAYVTNFLDDTLSVIETATNRVVDTVLVDGGPNWVTVIGRPGIHHRDDD